MHANSYIILKIYSTIIITFNVNNIWWINNESRNNIYAIQETVPCSIYIQEKFSSSWMKENIGIQPKSIPEKFMTKEKLDEIE